MWTKPGSGCAKVNHFRRKDANGKWSSSEFTIGKHGNRECGNGEFIIFKNSMANNLMVPAENAAISTFPTKKL